MSTVLQRTASSHERERANVARNAPPGPIDRAARGLLLRRLGQLAAGRIQLIDADGTHEIGDSTQEPITLTIHRPRFYRRAITGGALGAAAAYLDGDWDCPDLLALFRLFVRDQQAGAQMNNGRIADLWARLGHALRANTRRGSRRNIRDHYDLGDDLFELFLDESMTYSAAVFDDADRSLEDAQSAKLDRICRKLDLQPEHHVLEIGTGWGSFAVHAAHHYGCRVTTTTLSDAQYARATERVAQAGLADRVTVLQCDYRDLEGQYDRLVSIEMIEAVGHANLPTFFRCCGERLRPDGRMLLQVITTSDREYERYRRSVDFIQRYVFPGSLCPALSALTGAMARSSDLRITHLEDLSADYERTLHEWRDRFWDRIEDVRAQGYPERFVRLWDYYLQYCEAGFAERHIGDLQLVLARPGNRDAPIRPLLTATEENPA